MINFVYITTDVSSGRQYIGDHYGTPEDNYLGSGTYLIRAIKKYGRKNFKREILETFDSKKEAYDAQERYIEKFNTLSPHGFNVCLCGGTDMGGSHANETKEKIRRNSPKYWLGKNMSEESKEKNRLNHLGKKHTEISKKRISEKRKGQKPKKESIIKSSIARRSFSILEMNDILKMKSNRFGIKETSAKYPNISQRVLFYIRAGRYLT